MPGIYEILTKNSEFPSNVSELVEIVDEMSFPKCCIKHKCCINEKSGSVRNSIRKRSHVTIKMVILDDMISIDLHYNSHLVKVENQKLHHKIANKSLNASLSVFGPESQAHTQYKSPTASYSRTHHTNSLSYTCAHSSFFGKDAKRI